MTFGLLCIFLAAAAVYDSRTRRIPNRLVYLGIVVLWLCRGIMEGREGIRDGAWGLLGCGGLMLICYLLFDIGGGDVKLLAMIGVGVGIDEGIALLIWILLAAAALTLAQLVWKLGTTQCLKLLVSRSARAELEKNPPLAQGIGLSVPALLVVVGEKLLTLFPKSSG